MQFYLNGYRPGDPFMAESHRSVAERPGGLPADVDLLIIGCGPAGLVLAAQMSNFPDIRTVVIDRRDGPLEVGQADGVACRTVEMFEAFGLADRLLNEAYWVNEVCFWRPDADDESRIKRAGRIRDTEEDLSEFPHVIVNQARMLDYLREHMERSASRLAPSYGVHAGDIQIDTGGSSEYPVTVTVNHMKGLQETGDVSTIRAKYVVGCDGSHSSTRTAIGRQLTRYAPSMITGEPTFQDLAQGFPVGMRFHSAPVIRLADAKPIQLGHVARADGAWRIYVFADQNDPRHESSRARGLCKSLLSDGSPIKHFTPPADDLDSILDVRAIFQQHHRDLTVDNMPPVLLPRKGKFGLIDYEKMFCPDPDADDIFDLRGVNRELGCMVVVRPDQYVSQVIPLDAHEALANFFAAILLDPRPRRP